MKAMMYIYNGFALFCLIMAAVVAGGFVAGICGFMQGAVYVSVFMYLAKVSFDMAEHERRRYRKMAKKKAIR